MGTAHVKEGDTAFRPPLKIETNRADPPVNVTLTVTRVGDTEPFYCGPAEQVRVGDPFGPYYGQGLSYAIPQHVWDAIYKRTGEWTYEAEVKWPEETMSLPTEEPGRIIVAPVVAAS